MQSVMVELDGDTDSLILVALDTTDLRDVPTITVATAGSDISLGSLEWLLMYQNRRVFTYVVFQFTHYHHSQRVSNQFTDVATITGDGPNVEICIYPS